MIPYDETEVRCRVLQAIRDDEHLISVSMPLEKMARAIEQDQALVILRNVWSRERMLDFRQTILEWSRSTPVWPQGVSASLPDINFHRMDDGSLPGRMAHIFHQFGFGKWDELPMKLRSDVEEIGGAMFMLQNRLAGTDFKFGSPDFRIKAIRHPRGGGHLVPHTHPYLPQKVAVFLNLSEPGVDYHSGGLRFVGPDKKWIDTYEDFRCGDLLAWRYSMMHETSPVDAEAVLDWQSEDGLWIFAMDFVESHGLSHQANPVHG